MKPNQLTEMSEEEILVQDNLNLIATSLFVCQTAEQVDFTVSFAKFLGSTGLTRTNFPLFFRLVATNNPWVVDSLLGEREARLLFSSIPPNPALIRKAFGILAFLHPDVIYRKTLEAALGIIENAFYDPDDGYAISKVKIADLNTLGKYLEKSKSQEDPANALILEILDRLTHIGNYNKEPAKNVLARHAFNVRFAYFDRRKKMEDTIPQVLLYNASRRRLVTDPTAGYRDVLLRERPDPGQAAP